MGWNGGRGAGEQYRIDLFFFLNEVFFNGVNFITLSIYQFAPREITVFVGRRKNDVHFR